MLPVSIGLATIGFVMAADHSWLPEGAKRQNLTKLLQDKLNLCSIAETLTNEITTLNNQYNACTGDCSALTEKIDTFFTNLMDALNACSTATELYEQALLN